MKNKGLNVGIDEFITLRVKVSVEGDYLNKLIDDCDFNYLKIWAGGS